MKVYLLGIPICSFDITKNLSHISSHINFSIGNLYQSMDCSFKRIEASLEQFKYIYVGAACSVVTKSFTSPNIIIGGIPAKKIKENITWDKSPSHKE